jgi:hypothetical protein
MGEGQKAMTIRGFQLACVSLEFIIFFWQHIFFSCLLVLFDNPGSSGHFRNCMNIIPSPV